MAEVQSGILVAELGKWLFTSALQPFPFVGDPGIPGDLLDIRVLRIIWPCKAQNIAEL